MELGNLKDDCLIEELSKRLKQKVKEETGLDLMYGEFLFKIHKGKCVNIEFLLKDICYSTQNKSKAQGGLIHG